MKTQIAKLHSFSRRILYHHATIAVMENEPLLAYYNPRKRHAPSHLAPLTENNEVVVPLNPLEIKDRLIFGLSTSRDSAALVDALTLSLSSPRQQHCSTHDLSATPVESQSQLPRKPCSNPLVRRCKMAPAMSEIHEFIHQQPCEPKPQYRSNLIVSQAVIPLVIYLMLGVVIFFLNRHGFTGIETSPVVDVLYYCVVTMCTIGYGDITPTSTTTLFSILFVLVGFGFIDVLLSGMVSHVLDLQESHLLRTMKRSYVIDVKKGRTRIRMKVALALLVVVLCIGVCVCVINYVEKLSWIDSFYLSVMPITTVGYGDQAFKSFSGRIFAAIWLLLSTLAVAKAFLYLTELKVDKRNRIMTKWILGHDLSV